jgi:Ni/Co efflux regulator RcnB
MMVQSGQLQAASSPESFLQEIDMRVPLHHLAGIAAAALLVASAGTAQAQGKGQGKGQKTAQSAARGDDRHRDDHRVHDERSRDDRRVYESRGDYDPRYDRGRKGVPPGLAKKPGQMPPGQYKKLHTADHGAYVLSDVLGRRGYTIVRRADAGTSEYVYYRDRDGRVRRAIVSPGDDRLRFSNVPNSLLTEVLSRLY